MNAALDEAARAFVAALSYKPDWRFVYQWPRAQPSWATLYSSGDGQTGATVAIDWRVDDTCVAGNRIYLHGDVAVRDCGDVESSLEQLAWDVWTQVDRIERHERLHWLRCDGEKLWKPHPTPSGPLKFLPVEAATLPARITREAATS